MKWSNLLSFGVTLFLFGWLGPSLVGSERVPEFPVEHFFKNPQFTNFQISPDGNTLLALGPHANRTNLYTFEIETLEARRITSFTRDNIIRAEWASNERILYYQDRDGYESFGITAVNKDGSRVRRLVEPLADRAGFVPRVTMVIDLLPKDPDGVLVSNNDHRVDYPDVYHMNIFTGARRLLERNPGDVTWWVPDQEGVVRAAVFSERDSERAGVRFRPSAEAPWEELIAFGVESPGWSPLDFNFAGDALYVTSNLEEDKAGIYRFDLKERKMGEEIFRHELVDVSSVLMSRFHKALTAIMYQAEKPEIRWLSQEGAEIQALLDQRFPGLVNRVVSASEDETRLVIRSYSDRQPSIFHLLDFRGGSLRLVPLGLSRPWVDPETMAEMRPIWIEARDGTQLQAYLTLPVGRKEGERVPLVLHPHGGPWARDFWSYNAEVQFLANRGFAVLQVNFRGSTGFGREFESSSFRKFGTDMQDDLIDSVRWAIAQGYADPDRIASYGASYGGYATMMQMVLYPEVYKRGINYVGVVDLVDQVYHFRNRERSEEAFAYWQRRVGDPEDPEGRAMLVEHSPITHLEKLAGPVFIVHGNNDPRVNLEQAQKLRREMNRLKKPFEWLAKANEGHGFSKEENIIELYTRIDAFLAPLKN